MGILILVVYIYTMAPDNIENLGPFYNIENLSIVSLTSSLRGQLVKCFMAL